MFSSKLGRIHPEAEKKKIKSTENSEFYLQATKSYESLHLRFLAQYQLSAFSASGWDIIDRIHLNFRSAKKKCPTAALVVSATASSSNTRL